MFSYKIRHGNALQWNLMKFDEYKLRGMNVERSIYSVYSKSLYTVDNSKNGNMYVQ